ncbi:MAG TPA: SPOR domain-containing protein [Candidatus Binataceae bacterium]|nr:SPOR domain-containing protein [Candidatus Binataceae bacterium]
MRFDIRSGGIAGILIGILLLSGAVFVMGLLAGYDIGHQSQIAAQQVTESYTIPPPATAPSPAVPVAAASASGSDQSATVSSPSAASPIGKPKKQLAGATKSEIPVKPDAADAADETADSTDGADTSAPESSPSPAQVAAIATPAAPSNIRRKPFNIQIQAAMDAASANDMVKRLEGLGYRPHMTPTELNGSTWYKVVVGPYTTKEEAATAEAELRKKYNATYGGGGASSPPSDADSAPEEE